MTTIPCDLFPDLLLVAPGVSWTGPVLFFDTWGGQRPGQWIVSAYGSGGMANGADRERIRLDLSRPEVRAQLARVLAAGLLCPDSRARLPPSPPNPNGCRKCNGTGWLRRPSDVRHLLPVAEMGTLPDAWAHFAPALLAWHAEDVGRGGKGIAVVLNDWKIEDDGRLRRRPVSSVGSKVGAVVLEDGWALFDSAYWPDDPRAYFARGPETGPEGKRLADLAALAHGMALLDADGLRLPVGGGE